MTISEVAKQFDLTADTLRYYEKIGLIPEVPRTNGGIRDYDEETCNWIQFIKCMRKAGMQIDALTKYIELYKDGNEGTIDKRRELLESERERLIAKKSEIDESIDILNYKIKNYEEQNRG